MDIDKPTQNAVERRSRPDLVWGVDAIASVINRTPRQTNHMLASGLIKPAQKIGHRWVVSKTALFSFFGENP